MRQNNNIRIARELVRIANEIVLANDFQNVNTVRNVLRDPSLNNVKKLYKTMQTAGDDDLDQVPGDDQDPVEI